MQITRRRLLQTSGAGAAVLAAGCTTGPSDDTPGGGHGTEAGTPTPNTNEVHFLTDYSSEAWQNKWEDDIIPGFEDETGIPLNIEYVGMQGPGEERLTTLLQAGDAPESFTGTMTQVGHLVGRGQTAPVNDALSAIESENGEALFKSTIEPFPGEYHMVPHGLYLGGTFVYRRDIYEALGLDVPETWDELVHNARVIDESDEFDERGWALPGVPAGKSGSELTVFLANAGGGTWRWETEGERAEVWWDPEHVKAVFDVWERLKPYSPDPSSVTWAPTIQFWVGGRIAQCIMNNAWLAGPAYAAGATDIALGTDVAVPPKLESADPIDRGWALLDGHPVLNESDNPAGAKELLTYMYRGPRNQAALNLIEPMRFLPPYESVVDTDTYRSADVFQAEDGYFFDLNQKCFDDIAPNLQSSERPATPATLYAGQFPIDSEMVNQVIVSGRDVDAALSEARERLEQRHQEGIDLTEGS